MRFRREDEISVSHYRSGFREREDEISVKVGFGHGSSTTGFRPWVFSHGFRKDDRPWVFSHEIDRPRKKRESSGLR